MENTISFHYEIIVEVTITKTYFIKDFVMFELPKNFKLGTNWQNSGLFVQHFTQ